MCAVFVVCWITQHESACKCMAGLCSQNVKIERSESKGHNQEQQDDIERGKWYGESGNTPGCCKGLDCGRYSWGMSIT